MLARSSPPRPPRQRNSSFEFSCFSPFCHAASRRSPVADDRCRRLSRSRRREGRRQPRDAEPPPGSTPRRCRRCRSSGRAPRGHSSESTRCRRPCVPPRGGTGVCVSLLLRVTARPSGGPPGTSASHLPVAELDVLDGTDDAAGATSARMPRFAADALPVLERVRAAPRCATASPACAASELAQDRRDVVVDRSPREHEALRDLCVSQPLARAGRGSPCSRAREPGRALRASPVAARAASPRTPRSRVGERRLQPPAVAPSRVQLVQCATLAALLVAVGECECRFVGAFQLVPGSCGATPSHPRSGVPTDRRASCSSSSSWPARQRQ